MLFSDVIEEYLRVLAAGRYSEHTLRNYARTLRNLREFVAASLGHEPVAGEVTNDLMLSHGRARMEQLGRRSMDQRLYTLRSFWRWLNAAHGIENPMRRIIIPRATYPRLPKTITPEQIAAIIAADVAPDERRKFHDLRDRALIETLYASGCRVSEVVGLNWEDLEGAAPGDVRINDGKGDVDRVVLIGEPARDALEAWRRVAWVTDLGGPIFCNVRGERITTRAVQLVVDKRAARAGITENVHPHLFRHSFATHMMERGAGIADISNLLGHANLKTTTIYTHVNIGHLRKQIAHHPRNDPAKEAAVMKRNPATHLRDLAVECCPEERAQLETLKSQERALISKIRFVGATPRAGEEARVYLKGLRRLVFSSCRDLGITRDQAAKCKRAYFKGLRRLVSARAAL